MEVARSQQVEEPARSNLKHQPQAGACLHEAGLGPSQSGLVQAVLGGDPEHPPYRH